MDKSEIVREAQKRFKLCQEHDQDNFDLALESLKFKIGDQWHKDAKEERKNKRPMLTFNKMPQYIKQVVNEERQARPGIRVRPVDSEDDRETAEVFNGLIRHIENQSRAETVYDHGFEQAVDGGFGYWRIITKYVDDTAFEQEIFLQRIKNRFTVHLDPYADEPDRSDGKFAFVSEMIPKDDFKKKYPDASGESWAENTTEEGWVEKDAIRVAEYWCAVPVKKTLILLSNGQTIELPEGQKEEEFLAGLTAQTYEETGEIIEKVRSRKADSQKIEQHIIAGSDLLETNEWAGSFIPIVEVLGDETNVDGKDIKTGLIHHAKDAQVMYNYARTTMVEFISQAPKAPWIMTAKQLGNHGDMWKTANTSTRPYLIYDYDPDAKGAPKRVGMPTTPSGFMNEALAADQDMQATVGIFKGNLGDRSNETSGVAIAQREQQSDTGTFHFIDNLNRSIAYTGRILVDLIPKIYDTARQVRLLGIDDKETFVPINQEYQAESDETDFFGRPRMVTKIHDLSKGRYDVFVEAGQAFASKREETKTLLLDIIGAAPQYTPALLPPLMNNIDMEGTTEALEAIEQMNRSMGIGQTANQAQPGQGVMTQTPQNPTGLPQ